MSNQVSPRVRDDPDDTPGATQQSLRVQTPPATTRPRLRHGFVAQIEGSRLKGVQNKLTQSAPQRLHRKDAEGENSNPAGEGEE